MTRMTLITTIVAIAPMMASVDASAQTSLSYKPYHVPAAAAVPYVSATAAVPPVAWAAQDPAVALYRQGRTYINDSNFKKAAEVFNMIVVKYPRSTYAPDAYYWKAFALYKAEDYKEAREALLQQKAKHPKAATAKDGATLLTRVNGEIAGRGDSKVGQIVAVEGAQAGQGCPKGDDDIRIAALNSFLNMNAEQAVPLLKKIMARRDACSVELRRKAVFLVSQKRSTETEDILLSAARSDPDKEVRSQSVFWLSQVNTDRALEYLEDILKTSSDSEVRDKAVFAVSQHNSARAQQILRDYAGSQAAPDEIREKAIFWIGQKRSTENAAFLKRLYDTERNGELREKIIFSLSQQPGNQSWLMEVATNERENIEMRKKALFWAGQSKATSLPELTGLYEKMSNREMKDQLIFVYSQRREPAAVDKLMSIAKNEQDRELRKKAIFWLSQSKDPRVADYLMQLINQ